MVSNRSKDVKFIVGKYVYLRPIAKSDMHKGWLKWINDPDHRANLFGVFPVTEKDLKNYFNAQKLPESAMFAICIKRNNKYIGNIRLSSIDFVNKRCSFGRLIGDKNSQGKGYGSEALILVLRYAFETLGMNRVYSAIAKENNASFKSNIKVGMKKEGLLKEALFKNGKFIDEIIFSILSKDFFKKYKKIKL